MTRRLFEYDPYRGIRIDWEDTEGGGFALHYTQDCEPILDSNKAKQAEGKAYYAQDRDMWRVASVPLIIQMKWITEHGVDVLNPDHQEGVRRLLNSNEYKYLKTAEVII